MGKKNKGKITMKVIFPLFYTIAASIVLTVPQIETFVQETVAIASIA
jgi:hypothetical protein